MYHISQSISSSVHSNDTRLDAGTTLDQIVSYNCKHFNGSHLMIGELVNNYDIVFLVEHWLAKEEEHLIKKTLDHKGNLIFMSDFELAECRRGRPFGGLAWIINDKYTITNHTRMSKQVSKVTLQIGANGENNLVLFGVWLDFDDSTANSLGNFSENLLMLSEAIKGCLAENHDVILMGDWNADIQRGRRFDKRFRKFIIDNKVHVLGGVQNEHTYHNGDHTARIDYMLATQSALRRLGGFRTIKDARDTSDHRPIAVDFKLIPSPGQKVAHPVIGRNHKFNWSSSAFVEHYNMHLGDLLRCDIGPMHGLEVNSVNIERVYRFVCRCLVKSAREADKVMCAQRRSNHPWLRTRRVKTDSKARLTLAQMSKLLNKKRHSTLGKLESDQLCQLRRELRRREREKMREACSRRVNRLGDLFRSNRGRFWSAVAAFRRGSTAVGDIPVNEFEGYYRKLFSTHSTTAVDRAVSGEHESIRHDVEQKSKTLSNKLLDVQVSEKQVADAIGRLKKGKAAGHDGICNEMLLYARSTHLVTCLTWLFWAIVSSGILPNDFNIAIVVPIPKSKVVQRQPKDFRPISISSSLATLLEMLILESTADVLTATHSNQFGYRLFSSCKHAFFTLNETIQLYTQNKSSVYVASLDAEKAFDSLWRDGLFYKLAGRIPWYPTG